MSRGGQGQPFGGSAPRPCLAIVGEGAAGRAIFP